MCAFTEEPLPQQTWRWNVRSLLVLVTAIAVFISRARTDGAEAIQVCVGTSWIIGVAFAVGCAYTTAHSTRIRIRKFSEFSVLWTVFVACVSRCQ